MSRPVLSRPSKMIFLSEPFEAKRGRRSFPPIWRGFVKKKKKKDKQTKRNRVIIQTPDFPSNAIEFTYLIGEKKYFLTMKLIKNTLKQSFFKSFPFACSSAYEKGQRSTQAAHLT